MLLGGLPAGGLLLGRTRLGADAWTGVTADRYVVLHEDGSGADRPAVGIRRR